MKTEGYKIECDNKCGTVEFFETDEDCTDGDWYDTDGVHLCTDCFEAQENHRDEIASVATRERWENYR